MSKENEREFLELLRNKSIEAAAEIMESLQRLKLLYEEISDDGQGDRPPRPRAGDFFYRLAKFELEHASNILRLGNSQAEMIFNHVRQLARSSRGGKAAPTAVITLQRRDGTYAGDFEIRNPFETKADARFELGGLRDASGTEIKDRRLRVSCGEDGSVLPYQTARVFITLDDQDVTSTMFGDVTVFLSADVEKQVAHRAIKVKPEAR